MAPQSFGALTKSRATAKGPTGEVKLPHLPDQSMTGVSIEVATKRESTPQSGCDDDPTSTTLFVVDVAPPLPSVCFAYGSGLPITRSRILSRSTVLAGKSSGRKKTPLLVPPRMYTA